MPIRKNIYLKLLAFLVLILAGGIAAGGGWLAIKLIIDPDSLLWLNAYLPEWTKISLTGRNLPQTWAEIEQKLAPQDLKLGEAIEIGTEVLMPIQRYQTECNCNTITALRVYQPEALPQGGMGYYLIQEVAVPDLDEYFVISPLLQQNLDRLSRESSFFLTDLDIFTNVPVEGVWLNISGTQERKKNKIAYGHIFRYNPETNHLGVIIPWTSPTGKLPYWQKVTGGEVPELVVDQSIGLEPKFQVYQIQPRQFALNPFSLEVISLHYTGNKPDAGNLYDQGLYLSSQGLWSNALQKLETLKRNSPQQWTEKFQQQMAVIDLHAKKTQTQCKQPWARPSQQILACIVDGDWEDSLLVFQSASSRVIAEDIVSLLKQDRGRISGRVEAYLAVNPQATAAMAWGALIAGVEKDYQGALAWLQQQAGYGGIEQEKVLEVLDQWEFALITTGRSAPQTLHLSDISGIARPLLIEPNWDDWLRPENDPPPFLPPQHGWYVMEVDTFFDGQRLQEAPFEISIPLFAPGQQIWRKLGLDLDPSLQMVVATEDEKQTLLGRVQGVQFQDGVLKLLVSSQGF